MSVVASECTVRRDTGDAEVPRASSILDYVFARLDAWYEPPAEVEAEAKGLDESVAPSAPPAATGEVEAAAAAGGDLTPA